MGHRLSKIYTRTGDEGKTGLGDGSRVSKDDLRVEAFGTVDELNSAIGIVLAFDPPQAIGSCLLEIQHDLFNLGGELCIPGHTIIVAADIARLEERLDSFNIHLPPLKEFILPGGSKAASLCHMARTICRRAERRVVSLMRNEAVNPELLCYLNRLSDFLFVIARVLARSDGGSEVLWRNERGK